jgi:hypothetical protein
MKRLIILVCFLLSACAGQSTPPQNAADHFLGSDYALLKADPALKGDLVWRSPEFNPMNYTALYIEPVQLWNAEKMVKDSGLSRQDLDTLTNYFYQVLASVPEGTKLKRADMPGPGVISVRAAVTNVEASSPVSNALTSVVPIGMLISAGKQMTTGQAIGVGSCSVEIMFVDSVTGKKLVLFAGTKAGDKYSTASYSTTGQGEAAMKTWAALMRERIDVLWKK